ncbi:hypothetical protein FRC02_004769 [Tulasnella sp. 418]|nr:hypothetical protein FRC02_004769 [Tulasnella sp. 418]
MSAVSIIRLGAKRLRLTPTTLTPSPLRYIPSKSKGSRNVSSFSTSGGSTLRQTYVAKMESPILSKTRRRFLLILPFGGLLLYSLSPETRSSSFSSLLYHPSIIPPQQSQPLPLSETQDLHDSHPISSVSEVELNSYYIARFFREHVVQPIRTAKRFIILCFYFIPILVTSPMLLVGKVDWKELDGERWGAIWWYELLVKQMQRAGPTFIKLAQWAASRADLFPAVLCEKMGALHSTTKPHSLAHTKAIIKRVFKKPFHEVFEEFEEIPIGSGAIAQVYRATLKKDLLPPSYLNPKRKRTKRTIAADGTTPPPPPPVVPTASVAIKILHPRVEKDIECDLRIMTFFAKCITALPGMQWISLPEEVEVFGRMMREQLDLRGEVYNLKAFERNFNARRENAVSFPRPLEIWSSKEILIEEFENAIPLNAFLHNGGGPFEKVLATLGLDAFLNMLLLDNFVHSDLHPGNIMVKFYKPTTSYVLQNILSSIFKTKPPPEDPISSQDIADESDAVVSRLRPLTNNTEEWLNELEVLSKEGYQPELVLLDAGLVTTLDEQNRRNFLDLFRAIAEFDGYRAGKLMIERCRTPDLVLDPETFALKIQHLVLSVKAKTFSLGQIKISDVLTEVLKGVRTHHVKMEGDFVNTIISILLLEGIGRRLDPDMDLFKSALPILRKLGRQVKPKDALEMQISRSSLWAMLKIWVWIEARELAHSAFSNADDFVRYDWLTPNI